MAGMLGARNTSTSGIYFELYVQSWSYCCRIVRASNGLGQLGLAKTRPSRDRCRGHSIGTPVLKSLWLFRIAYLCSFSETTACDLAQGSQFPSLCCAKIRSSRCSCLRPFDQICALPPSTNSSIPVTKLESSEAKNNAAFATSPGSPMRPIGMVETIRAITSGD